MSRHRSDPAAVLTSLFVGVSVVVGGFYWRFTDWNVYIDDGNGGQRPFDVRAPEGQLIASGLIGLLAGGVVAAVAAYCWLFWSQLERGDRP